MNKKDYIDLLIIIIPFIVLSIWMAIKFIALKKVRKKLLEFIDKKSENYAIIDFLGKNFKVENYEIEDCNITKGYYWNNVYAIKEGRYKITCDFEYNDSKPGQRIPSRGITNDINIMVDIYKGKQYRIRLSEDSAINKKIPFKINFSISIKKKPRELILIFEERL